MRMKALVTALGLALTSATVLVDGPRLHAQADTAQLSGYVRDASGSVIPGATVVITNEATGVAREVQSNENGYYVVSALPPAYYTVAVEAEGFKRGVQTNNKLDANLASQVDVVLEVGAITESIEVRAQAVQLQSETATVGRLVEETQIKNITLNGRNPLFLAMLKPGVTRSGSLAGFSFGLTSGGFSINGSRSQDNIISMDGAVNMRTRSNGTSVGVADLETVQEMQILTANYNAEYGRSSAGQIRFVTKSGSQDFHGSFYEYFRNEKLDANSWSRNRSGLDREARKFNQFGYVLSGPVYIPGKWNSDKNKLFWLWSQEWVRFRREVTSIRTVPSLAMREGDFSELLGDNAFFGNPQVVRDPVTGDPFPNNVISADRLSKNGLGMLAAYPLPTPGFQQGSDNFIQTRPQPTDQRKDTVSIDYNPTQSHAFRFRLQNYGLFEPEAFRGGTDRAVRTIDRPNRTYTLNHIWTASPTWINEFLASVSYDRVYLEVPVTPRLDRSTYGIDYPYVFSEPKEIDIKIPTIAISNFVTVDGGPYPASSSGPIYQLSNNVTKIFGNHTFKFGGRFERAGQNDFDQINVSGVPGGTNNQNGRFQYTDDRLGAPSTGLAIANAAMGLFTRYAEIGPRAYTPYRSLMGEFFVQDSWKATQKLRIELGLRYSLLTPYYYSVWRNMAVFDPNSYDPNNAAVLDPATGNVLSGNRYNGVVIPGDGFKDDGRVPISQTGEFDHLFNGGPKYWGQVQKKNFQPRIGIAYRIGEKSVLRSGFGRYYARPGVADNIFLGGNPPFQPMASISTGLADNPGGGEAVGFPQFFMTNDPVYKIPSSIMWNATFQREIGFNTLIEAGYVGRVGSHLERVRDLNQNPVGTMLRPDVIENDLNPDFLRPYKGFANIIQGENAARSEYNGLQLSANRRFNEGLSFGVAYTYGKSVDNADGRRDRIYNNYDDSNFWGPSDFDIRQSLVTNFVWELPFFQNPGLARSILGGWTVSGVVQFQTGRPRTIELGVDYAGIGEAISQPWEVLENPRLSRGDRGFSEGAGNDDVYFFSTNDSTGRTIFTPPAPGTFSQTQNRNQWIRDPGFQNWNLGVFKQFQITERQSVSFRGEFFNLPNHPNLSGPQLNPTNSNFGRVTAKNSERNVQLSLRYSF